MGRAAPRQVRRTEKQWREILGRLDASGLSSREFSHREGLSLSSLQRWRSRCGRSSVAKFVELATPARQPAAGPVTSSTSWTVELDLPGGARLRFRG